MDEFTAVVEEEADEEDDMDGGEADASTGTTAVMEKTKGYTS
jgi:hypothetical protein